MGEMFKTQVILNKEIVERKKKIAYLFPTTEINYRSLIEKGLESFEKEFDSESK